MACHPVARISKSPVMKDHDQETVVPAAVPDSAIKQHSWHSPIRRDQIPNETTEWSSKQQCIVLLP